ncbi:MAG: EamA family transporter [Thermoanaerobaculia bacterium]|nr:EamA family transporter [Thermoanaerobaculia bacterium]
MSGARPLALVGAFLALVLIWGSTWGAIRVGLGGIPPYTGVSLRFGLAALVLFATARALGVKLQYGPRVRMLWIVETVFGFCISYGVVYWAEDQGVPSGLGSVLFATFPLFVALLAWIWLAGERPTPAGVVGLLLGFGGVLLIFSDDLATGGDPRVLFASVLFLLSPAAAAVAHVVVKRYGGGIHPINLAAPPMAACGVIMGAVALAVEGEREVVFDAVSVGALLYLAIFGSAVTFTLYYWLLARATATRVALVTYGIPVVALFLGTVFLHEPLTAKTVTGAALVIGGVALAS